MRNYGLARIIKTARLSKKPGIAKAEIEIGSLLALLIGFGAAYLATGHSAASLIFGLVSFGAFVALIVRDLRHTDSRTSLDTDRPKVHKYRTILWVITLSSLVLVSLLAIVYFPIASLLLVALLLASTHLVSLYKNLMATWGYRNPRRSS